MSIDCRQRAEVGYQDGKPFDLQLITIDGKPVEAGLGRAFAAMRTAAAADGVELQVVSGFRTMAEQIYLFHCYVTGTCNNGNLAAKPGYSNHQNGHALDLNMARPGVTAWMSAHAGAFGFAATVPSEPWHWEWWGGGPPAPPCRDAAQASSSASWWLAGAAAAALTLAAIALVTHANVRDGTVSPAPRRKRFALTSAAGLV